MFARTQIVLNFTHIIFSVRWSSGEKSYQYLKNRGDIVFENFAVTCFNDFLKLLLVIM